MMETATRLWEMSEKIESLSDEVERLRAETERLREALDILQAAMVAKRPIPLPFKIAINQARAALGEEKKG
jgi:regulator of replication initiation timing